MPKKNKLIIETHNPYTADIYEYLVKRYADDYEIEEHTRKFISHEGEKDYRVYTRFKMMVTKDQELKIRDGVRRSQFPTFKYYEDGYVQTQVRSGFRGVPLSFSIKEDE